MGNLDNSENSESPGSSRALVVGLSRQGRNSNGSSTIRDPFIIDRINQYLNDNRDKAFVEINDMVDALRNRYREYRRRNWYQFKVLVERAFKVVSAKAGVQENLMHLSDSSGSEVEEYRAVGENHAVNNSNSQLLSLYQGNKTEKMPGENLELINLSSGDERSDGGSKQKRLNRARDKPSENTGDIPAKLLRNPDVSVSRRQKPASGVTSGAGGKRSRSVGEISNVTFDHFGGSPAVLEELCKLILHLKHPEVFRSLGVSAPRGFLLHGPPGCGKTLLATAIAGELKVPLIKVSGPELVGGVSGESEERVRDLFASALDTAPCVVFIDEVDAITPNRQTAQREMERRIVAQLITSLDDLAEKDESGQVLVIGATKRPDALDPALRRAGRFDKEVCLGIPDVKARQQILRVLCAKVTLAPDLDLGTIALMTPGFVGADLLSLVRESAMVAIVRVFEDLRKQREEKNDRKRKREPNDLPVHAKRSIRSVDEPTKEIGETVVDPSPGQKNGQNEDTEKKKEGEKTVSTESNCKNEKTDKIPENEKTSDQEGDKKVLASGAISDEKEKTIEKEKKKEEEKAGEKEEQKGGKKQADSEIKQSEDNKKKEDKISDVEIDIVEPCDNVKGEQTQMDLVGIDSEEEIAGVIEVLPVSPLSTLLAWVRDDTALNSHQLRRFTILQSDFITALRSVQPSAKREGFATVPDVTWEDVGSLASVQEHLIMTILGPIKCQAQFERLGLVAPAGVLLCGPPGCGKTLLAKAVANEAGINFISVKGPELLNMYVGESERAVRTVFQRARNSAPCVIFFDELDALCPRRTEGDAGAGMRVVNQMLTEMDGVGDRRGVFLMAATNRPDIVDPAVLRPGRLDKTIYIGLPSAVDRKDILLAITKNGTKPPLDSDVSLVALAARPELDGWTGADLAALMREAAMQAVRESITYTHHSLCIAPATHAADIRVSAAHIDSALKTVRPSVSKKDLKRYEEMRQQFAAPECRDRI